MTGRSARTLDLRRLLWPVLIVALTLTPVAGLFTRSKIFYVRDLSFFFWSRHLWLRHTIFGGAAPWWDPYVASGQSAIADALNQALMPITLAIRLLPSDVISFNLWVALPIPLAALGTYAFLRRERSAAGAALGACAFGLAGVPVSMLNAPNLAWSVAGLPWVMWGADRLIERPSIARLTSLAVLFALQALSGEPVTCACTALVALAYALETGTLKISSFAWTAAGLGAGAMLAAAQLVPTILAGIRAHRGGQSSPDFWSLHPLAAIELVTPHIFGNYYDAFLADIPWMTVLNSGRDPFFYSIYIGPVVLLLALAGLVARPSRGLFWLAIGLVFGLAAAGGYTPFYPLARRILPALAYFRFPVKYLAISSFACAVLAAGGWDALRDRSRQARMLRLVRWTAIVAVLAALAVFAAAVLHQPSWNAAYALARWLKITDSRTAADFLMRLGPPLAGRAAGLLLAASALMAIAVSQGRRAPAAAGLLFIALCADLGVTNANLNLTSDATKLAPPPWYTQLASSDRVYIGARVRGFMNSKDPDAAPSWKVPAESTAIEGRMELNAELPMAPSGWKVREALSYDLPVLWPSDYEAIVRAFEHAGRPERAAFLRRSGVRWCVLPPTVPGFTPIVEVAHWEMRLVECGRDVTRVFVTTGARVGPDRTWQRAALFDSASPDEELRLESIPAMSGTTSAPAPPSARITEDGINDVTVEASLPADGYLVLRDSYDPSWNAQVDGIPAEVVRANGLYRAVRLPGGRHVIRFHYRPRDLVAGLTITGMTTTMLGAGCVLAARRKRRGTALTAGHAGFTLVELMIVMALIGILLAIAFARYHGIQSRGNEASALASLRSIVAAEWTFAQTCGHQKYAVNLPALGQPVPSTGSAFLSPDLTSAEIIEKSGYRFRIAAAPIEDAPQACNGTPVAQGYAATADPINPGSSGNRFFAVNADRLVYEDSQTFNENMPESGPPAHGAEVK